MRQRTLKIAFSCCPLLLLLCTGLATGQDQIAGRRTDPRSVTITRDDWGIPHIHGTSDADAVFGLMYAQAEDDFHRIEMNLLNALGRTGEALGETRVFADLRMRLIVEPDSLKALYRISPDWLQKLMNAWADGLNFYLMKHPRVSPLVLKHFEPWMALSFSEGSIGWDIETVSVPGLEAFYSGVEPALPYDSPPDEEDGGSNGFALSGMRTRSGRPLLWINPHTSHYYRAEVHVTSDEGMNAYGAVTWGQFFVYQGFNQRVGWMHTSTGADAIDDYRETVARHGKNFVYHHGDEVRPVSVRKVRIGYRSPGGMKFRRFSVYATHHGPVVRMESGKWIALHLMYDPIHALMQSFLRTKAISLDGFRDVLDLHANSSNNTVYADADGNIAYFHANWIPRRNNRHDWKTAVDGSDTSTDWHGIHSVDESPNAVNPSSGWIQNTNNWPYSCAGPASPNPSDFPAYMDKAGENARGRTAARLLAEAHDFTVDSLTHLAFNPYLQFFEDALPPLHREIDSLLRSSAASPRLREADELLRNWDRCSGIGSVPTTLAVCWAADLYKERVRNSWKPLPPGAMAQVLNSLLDTLEANFGTWRVSWGEMNRYQRRTGEIVQEFRDSEQSLPVGFGPGRYGSLAAFEARRYPGTKRMYGTSGNSFVACVEFGDTVRAMAVTAGGSSGDPASPHFRDQAGRFLAGNLREVYLTAEAIQRHAVRMYHPGE